MLYNNIETIFEVCVYIICLVFDIACLIKIRKMLKDTTTVATDQERKRDKILVIQVLLYKRKDIPTRCGTMRQKQR